MKPFVLDPQLQQDCFLLKQGKNSLLLLFNNSLVPWFILVPKTDKTEWFQLEASLQQTLLHQINELSAYVQQEFQVDKLNVACIGNVVSQLHVHVVGRYKNDYCWPAVVWGCEGGKAYQEDEVADIAQQVDIRLTI